jgi:hypothetical protein
MRVVNDRRSSTRVAVRGEALVHALQGPVRCRCLDISPSGMSLVCPQAIKPKQRVRIESSFRGQRLVLEAVVVRRRRSREGHVLGVRFEGMSPQARDALAEVLRSMQVQAALAMQASAFVDRLPVLQIPEPEPEPRTEKTPSVVPVAAMPPPVAATPAMLARHGLASTDAPGRWDSTMITPPSGHSRAGWPGGAQPVGLDAGWTEEELVTTHYRPSSDGVEAPDAADCTEVTASAGSITVPEVPLPDWEVGAPVALAELVETDAGSRSIPSLDDEWLEPVRTGRTMVVHVQDLIAAYAPPVEPEVDLPEAIAPMIAPITAPITAPRLSDELQAALDRLRRREGSAAEPLTTDAEDADEPAPRPSTGARRRRRLDATEVYASPRRDDTQVRALYHAALVTLDEPDRGDGS